MGTKSRELAGLITTDGLNVDGVFTVATAGSTFATRDDGGGFSYTQGLDVATAGCTITGASNRGNLASISLYQTATGADGGYIALRTSPSGSTTPSERMRIDQSGNVGIGTTSPNAKLDVDYGGNANKIKITNSGNARVELGTSGDEGEINLYRSSNTKFTYLSAYYSSYILNPFGLSFGKTDSTFGVAGIRLYTDSTYNGYTEAVTDGVTVMALNRLTSDGNLMAFYQASSLEGVISVSGTLVSYLGGHLARWTQMDSDNGSLLKGTVMTNLDDMCVWKQAVFTTQHLVSPAVEAVEAVAEIPEELDDEGNVIQEYVPAVEAVEAQDAVYEDVEQKETYEGDAADGDVIDFEFEGQTYSATVVFEDNEQLNKMEVSSVEGDANVAGVFVSYDDDGDITIAMTGDLVIRIAQGTTVARGDLLMSAGDGTAKPQGDDIVRAKTIAKVTSTHVSHTYDDGSYLVPCVLMAC